MGLTQENKVKVRPRSSFSGVFISIVIPICNEAENLPSLIERLENSLESVVSYEVIFVNDGSSDQSAAIVLDHRQRNARLKMINFSRNFGHQQAITAGLHFAKGDAVIVMDGDLQDPPEILPLMIERWKEGWEVVYAVRRRRKENMAKRTAYFLFYRFLNRLSPIHIPVDSGDFAIMDRRIVDLLNQLPERNRFIRGLRGWLGFRQTALEYERSARYAGQSKYSLYRLLHLAYDGLISFSDNLLSVATYTGLICAGIALVGIGVVVYLKLINQIEVEGWASTAVLILFVGGIQLFSVGILGEYVRRIYDEVKQRPTYIVDDLVGLDRDE